MEPIALGPVETAPGRPFTSVDLYPEDIECLRELIADLCGVLRGAAREKRSIRPFESFEWETAGLLHRLIVCDQTRLMEHDALSAVGFFSQRHSDVDIAPLEEANLEVVQEFRHYPGILSYGSIQLPEGRWANLVVHEEPETAERWRESVVHAAAVDRLSPIHYRNVRIHNARLTSSLSGAPDIEIVRTKYFDYENGSDWRAIREFPASRSG